MKYDLYFRAAPNQMPQKAREVYYWLAGEPGYHRLEDDYDPAIFRLARYAGNTETENTWNTYGRFSPIFDCKPQKFLKTGETELTCTNGGTIANAWMPALPLITISGTAAGTVTVGGVTVSVLAFSHGNIILDCEIGEAYNGVYNLNGDISAPNFPVLNHGNNTVSWTGGISAVKIVPRWWCL